MGAPSQKKKRASRQSIERDIGAVVEEARGARGPHDDRAAMERATRERVLEPLADERVASRTPIRITLLPGVGPEPWDLIFTTGKNYGGAKAGRVLIVLPGGTTSDPLAGLAYAVEYGRPYVHHVWVDAEARGRGLSRVLFDAYRAQVSPTLVVVGPFTSAGREAARRAGAILEE